MSPNSMGRLRTISPAVSRAGIALLLTLLVYAMIWLLRFLYPREFPLDSILGFLSVWAACYLVVYGVLGREESCCGVCGIRWAPRIS